MAAKGHRRRALRRCGDAKRGMAGGTDNGCQNGAERQAYINTPKDYDNKTRARRLEIWLEDDT